MRYTCTIALAVIAHLLFVSAAFAEKSPAYSMNKDWQACQTSGIPDSEKFVDCIRYPDSGKNFEACENPPRAIYFSLHAEYRFRDIHGNNMEPDYILSAVGQKMAQHLAKIFKPIPVKAIYTSHYTRTRQTACPLMRDKGVERHVVCKTETKSERFLMEALCKAHRDEVVVVIGHHDTVKEILINLKVMGPLDVPELKYGVLYKVTFQNGKPHWIEPPVRYWNCDPSDCYENGALDVTLK